jgi:hypothetical protein
MAVASNCAVRIPVLPKKAVEEFAREDATTLDQFMVSAVAEILWR